MDKNTENDEYMKDWLEWQEKKNVPGYYLGGKLSPILKYNRGIIGNMMVVGILAILFFMAVGLGIQSTGKGRLIFIAAAVVIFLLNFFNFKYILKHRFGRK